MRMKKVLMGCVGLAVCMAHGAVLVDGFESYTVGNTVYGSNGWINKNTSATQGGWVAAKESAFSSGSQSLHFTDTDSANGLYDARVQNSLTQSIMAGTFSFDVNLVSFSSNPSFFIRDTYMGTQGVMVLFDNVTKTIKYNPGPGLVAVSTTVLSLDTWYHIEIEVADVSGATDTFNIRVLEENGGAGTEIINESGLGFRNDIASISDFEFATNAGLNTSGANFYLDNVTVIPEPATLGLLGFSTLCLFLIRRTLT